jgi:hypothetical protein
MYIRLRLTILVNHGRVITNSHGQEEVVNQGMSIPDTTVEAEET